VFHGSHYGDNIWFILKMGLCCFDVIVIVTWWFLIIKNSISNLFEIFSWTFRIIPVYCLWALWYICYIESLKWFPFHIWISTVSLNQKCYFLWANCCITLWWWQAAMESLKDQPLPGSFVLLELEDLCCCQIWTCLVFCLVVCVFCEHDCVVCEHGCVVCEHGCLASPKHVCVVCYMPCVIWICYICRNSCLLWIVCVLTVKLERDTWCI
jgi:hypothetical protein